MKLLLFGQRAHFTRTPKTNLSRAPRARARVRARNDTHLSTKHVRENLRYISVCPTGASCHATMSIITVPEIHQNACANICASCLAARSRSFCDTYHVFGRRGALTEIVVAGWIRGRVSAGRRFLWHVASTRVRQEHHTTAVLAPNLRATDPPDSQCTRWHCAVSPPWAAAGSGSCWCAASAARTPR